MLNDKEETIHLVAGEDKADGDQSVDEITGIVKISLDIVALYRICRLLRYIHDLTSHEIAISSP